MYKCQIQAIKQDVGAYLGWRRIPSLKYIFLYRNRKEMQKFYRFVTKINVNEIKTNAFTTVYIICDKRP